MRFTLLQCLRYIFLCTRIFFFLSIKSLILQCTTYVRWCFCSFVADLCWFWLWKVFEGYGDEVAMKCVTKKWKLDHQRVIKWDIMISFFKLLLWFQGAVFVFGLFEFVQPLCCGHVWFSLLQWVNYGIPISLLDLPVVYIIQLNGLLKEMLDLLNLLPFYFLQVSFSIYLLISRLQCFCLLEWFCDVVWKYVALVESMMQTLHIWFNLAIIVIWI